METLPEELHAKLSDPKSSIFILTGAGISAAANIPTYRGENGLYPTGTLIPLEAKDARSRTVHELWQRIQPVAQAIAQAEPTAAHKAIARAQSNGRNITVATQNIDGLHTKAGGAAYELHGSLAQARCLKPGCKHRSPTPHLTKETLPHTPDEVARCEKDGARLRPDAVLFGELLDRDTVTAAANAAAQADVVLAIGTSLQVYPAAGFVLSALAWGAAGAWIDLDPAAMLDEVDPVDKKGFSKLFPLAGDAQTIVPQLLALAEN